MVFDQSQSLQSFLELANQERVESEIRLQCLEKEREQIIGQLLATQQLKGQHPVLGTIHA